MKLRKLFITMILSCLFVLPLAYHFSGSASAAPKDEVCAGIGAASDNACGSNNTLTTLVRNIINILSIIIGVVAVIMLIVGGFRFVMAGGDSGNITSARQTITYALVGLVIAALSQSLVWFVLNKVG